MKFHAVYIWSNYCNQNINFKILSRLFNKMLNFWLGNTKRMINNKPWLHITHTSSSMRLKYTKQTDRWKDGRTLAHLHKKYVCKIIYYKRILKAFSFQRITIYNDKIKPTFISCWNKDMSFKITVPNFIT